ncbi:MAG: family 16 glycosylhydrolase, partial [Lewinella sp.]|nr:family 16 glycosylhydrolase [Lewinella sp.]
HFRVSSTNIAALTATEPASPADPLTFTMPTGPCASDASAADFNLGTPDGNTAVVLESGGAVILNPVLNEEFSGTTIPSGWAEEVWDGQAGASATYSGEQVTADGVHVYTTGTFGPGTALEFSATYTPGNFQNIGFTNDAGFNNPWVVIGRGSAADNNIYARTSDNQSAVLGTDLLNAPHKYKIKWLSGTNTFEFYVDDALVATPSVTQAVSTAMNVQISDYPAGGLALSVDWVRIGPYAASGSFTSRVFDAGTQKTWDAAAWSADLPANTGVSIFTRNGDTPTPDGTWTTFSQVAASGNPAGGTSRYIQYRADLSTTDPASTPVFRSMAIECLEPVEDLTPPVISNIVATPAPDGLSAVVTWQT